MDRRDWLRIGQEATKNQLRVAAKQLKLKWPGRYDFRISKDSDTKKTGERNYSLYLSHR